MASEMTPLEIAAEAHWSDSENISWQNLPADAREDMIEVMRVTLLALEKADVTIPARLCSRPVAMRVHQRDRIEVFRAMCRAIAEDRG
jgi:hypothetical protein